MGEHRPASFNSLYGDSFLNLQHFDAKPMGAAQRGKKLRPKNPFKKLDFTGLKIFLIITSTEVSSNSFFVEWLGNRTANDFLKGQFLILTISLIT